MLKASRWLFLDAFWNYHGNKLDVIVVLGFNTLLSYWPVFNVYEKLCTNNLEFEREERVRISRLDKTRPVSVLNSLKTCLPGHAVVAFLLLLVDV